MANFTVDPNVLNQKAKELDGHADNYDAISARLQNAATTMDAAYDSADNRTFVSRMEECAKDLKAMANKLRAASVTLQGQSKIYSTQETENTQAASRLPG